MLYKVTISSQFVVQIHCADVPMIGIFYNLYNNYHTDCTANTPVTSMCIITVSVYVHIYIYSPTLRAHSK